MLDQLKSEILSCDDGNSLAHSNITKFWIVAAERANHGCLLQAKTALDLLATDSA
jgi:hypothetical protein